MKRQTLAFGLLSLTAVSILTGCVDDKYDLSNIDTTSRFTVDNLTVPVNLDSIYLKNVVNLDDNENISTIDGAYAISKGGTISPTEFNINPISVNAPDINQINISVPSPGVAIPGVDLPAINLPHVDMTRYDFNMNNIDKALQVLNEIKTTPINIQVTLSVPSQLSNGNNKLAFQNLKIQLPWGLLIDNKNYNKETGILDVGNIETDANGHFILALAANGLNLMGNGEITDGHLGVHGEVGIVDGAKIKLTINESVSIPSPIEIKADFKVSGFTIEKFSGLINYNMDAIHIDPIKLNDLPDFLDSPETNIVIANPQILVNIKNPVGNWLGGKGRIILKSNFKNGSSVTNESGVFNLQGNASSFAFCTPKAGYTTVPFDGLRYVLSNGNAGLPSSIEVDIEDINFSGEVTDFPLGNLGDASGDYEFNAPLGFGEGSMVVYESTESGWGSDDLDDVNINRINLRAVCSTDLPVNVQVSVNPIDKNGNEIPVKEESGLFEVPANGQNHPVSLFLEGANGPIKNFDGVKFRAVVKQSDPNNTSAISPDLHIILKDIRVTVDGYYETDF